MPLKDLKEKYGRQGKARQAINRAIRAELPGGHAALDAVEKWHGACHNRGWVEGVHLRAYVDLLEIVDAMEDEIRRRYEMPPRKEREDLRRG